MVNGRDEDKVSWFHVFLFLNGDWKRITQIRLVPWSNSKAKFLLQVPQDLTNETTAVEELWSIILRICNQKANSSITAMNNRLLVVHHEKSLQLFLYTTLNHHQIFVYWTYKMTNPHQFYMFAFSSKFSLFSLSLVGISKEHYGW